MGGKSKAQTVGYHYRPAFHVGLVGRMIDAFLEYRAADKTAWAGELTASGRIQIDAPDLFGGEKDQGGIVGPVDVMFGEPEQVPNPYLVEEFGEQTAAWRGMTTLAFCGGRFGAMNPYQQKSAYKIRKIKAGWDGDWGADPCWYPTRAKVAAADEEIVAVDAAGWEYQQLPRPPGLGYNPGYDNLIPPADGWTANAQAPFGNWSPPGYPAPNTLWEVDTILWVRRSVSVPSSKTAVIQVVAENGCVILINGAFHASANRDNEQHVGDPIVYEFRLPPGDYELAIKAYDEHPAGPNVYLTVSVLVRSVAAMNPAHMLYYVRTDGEKGREPLANINDGSLRAAADRLYLEGFGLCAVYDPQQDSPDAFNERICRIIGGSFERSLVDGQWYLDLARGDYDPESLPVIGDDDILELKEQPTTLSQAVNSISVRYFDPERKESVITPAVRALGLIRQFGEIHETLDFPEIPTAALALRVADRELRARVSPIRAFELVTTPRVSALRRNQYFRLHSPRRGIAGIVCIVGDKQHGTLTSGAIRWKVSEDVYSMPAASYIDVEPGVDTRPPQIPQKVTQQRAFEAPYIYVAAMLPHAELQALPEDAGYLLGVAAQPEHGLDYSMVVAAGGGEYAYAATADWCPTATLADALPWGEAPVEVALDGAQGLAQVPVGSVAMIGAEILRVDAISASAGSATLARGCADTLPLPHGAGARIWFIGEAVAADTTEYSWGDQVLVRILTNTGSQQLHLSAAPVLPLEFAGRAARPYSPALLRITGAPSPAAAAGEFVVTWAHRDRIGQADQLVDAGMGSIGPEETGRYGMRLLAGDSDVLIARTDIAGDTATVDLAYTGPVTLELWAVNDAGDSLQRHVRTFDYTAGAAVEHVIDAPVYEPPYTIIDGGEVT